MGVVEANIKDLQNRVRKLENLVATLLSAESLEDTAEKVWESFEGLFAAPEDGEPYQEYTIDDLKTELGVKVSNVVLGKILTDMGLIRGRKRRDGKIIRCYRVVRKVSVHTKNSDSGLESRNTV